MHLNTDSRRLNTILFLRMGVLYGFSTYTAQVRRPPVRAVPVAGSAQNRKIIGTGAGKAGFVGIFFGLAGIAILAGVLYLVLRTRNVALRSQALVPMAGRVEKVPGGSIHFVESGAANAQTVVLIHGLSGQLQHFTYAMADLLCEDFHVVAIDRPGCGYSERDSDDLADIGEQASMIGAFMDARGLKDPVLVGHSLGGSVALAVALQRGERIAALALLCPATHEPEETPEMFRGLEVSSPLMRRLIGFTIAVPMAQATAEKVLNMVFAPDTFPDDFLVRAGGALGLRPKSFVTASGDAVALPDALVRQVAEYENLSVPGGVLFAADDNVLAPSVHGEPMQKFGLEYEEIAAHGHMIPITAPRECAEFVRRMAAKSG